MCICVVLMPSSFCVLLSRFPVVLLPALLVDNQRVEELRGQEMVSRISKYLEEGVFFLTRDQAMEVMTRTGQ